MNGELAQLVALATHGTAWLLNPQGPPPALDTTSSTFSFVHSVEFAIEERRGIFGRRRRTTMGGVARWLDRLRSEGTTRLWLVVPRAADPEPKGRTIDAHMAVAFAGAGSWLLLATGGSRPEIWGASWQVDPQGGPDSRIWDVRYDGLRNAHVAPPRPSVAGAGEALRSALIDIEAFSREHELSTWTEWFGQALDALDDDAPEPPYHPDMLPPSYPADAARLLASAAQSWVFGGMGSWNDLGFEQPEADDRYHRLSRRLYATMTTAFVAAVNVDL